MRRLIISTVILLYTCTAAAQQLHFTSQYLLHNSMYNPAAAGMTGKNSLGMSYRNQWSSFPGNPKTFMLYGDFALPKMNAGLGAYLYRDVTGPTSRTGVQMAYSYQVKLNDDKARLGLGLEFRVLQFAIDKGKLTDALANDPVLSGASNKIAPDAGAGIYYTNGKLSAGLAVSQLIESKLTLANVSGTDLRAKLYRHYNFSASYQWQTGENIYLIPNFMYRVAEHAPAELDLGCKLDYQQKLWFALAYRNKQFWSVQAGLSIMNRVGLGYSYDYYLTPSTLENGGFSAHEFSLRFDLKK
ncbi:MAG: type IX secretion system membrane protein PorP/SprF [Chitinophagaceae bacterium]